LKTLNYGQKIKLHAGPLLFNDYIEKPCKREMELFVLGSKFGRVLKGLEFIMWKDKKLFPRNISHYS
jgi:hypothetical protein